MADMKSLARDTAIYGLSSIVGRFLNYLLVPVYTYAIAASSGGYGVITNLYAYTALLLVILTYGMETTFFRFANKEGEDPKLVYSTILRMIGGTSLLFIALVFIFIGPVSRAMGYPDHPSYIWSLAIVVALDAFQAILFSYLRYQKRPVKFAALKLLFIILNIALNLLFFVLLPKLYQTHPDWVGKIYDPSIGVGYVFYINLFCTSFVTFFFLKEIRGIGYGFDAALSRRMLSYSWPILVLGIAGILNQTADKILFPKICPGEDANAQLGIYGAASKIAMIMAMITQAFRYAYEPFVFGNSRDRDSKETYAKGMKYFVIFTLLAFLCVMGYMNILRYIIRSDYWDGLRVVPIVMAAEIMMGIYFNLSFWYKLTDKTIWGAVFSGIGCAVLIAVNVIFVPKFGYMACAWGGFAGYGTAMLLSYFVGQKHYPIAYPIKEMAVYVLITAIQFAGILWSNTHLGFWPALIVNTFLILVFCFYIVKKDLPLSGLPVIGKYFKKQ
ncbi:MAG: lipopolysaccharide biosynthesis protein [Bacteroidales bacterium]|nr:lipopolysaccharide biosynthesis protein [Bacteroidales bacterium]